MNTVRPCPSVRINAENSITFKHDYTEKIKTFSNRVMVSADVLQTSVIIPVTRRIKGYARFVGKL